MSLQKAVGIWWLGCFTGIAIISKISLWITLGILVPLSFIVLMTEPLQKEQGK